MSIEDLFVSEGVEPVDNFEGLTKQVSPEALKRIAEALDALGEELLQLKAMKAS